MDANGNGNGSTNPNDEVRRQMLHYFYERSQKARSMTGKYGVAARISDVKADLRMRHGLTQPQVISNLQYLVDQGLVNKVPDTKQIPVKRGILVASTTYFYEISAAGTDKIEGGSEFQSRERFAGINIEATGNNTITVGHGNYVNANYRQLFTSLSELREQIVANEAISETEKFSTAVDIDTLQDQLAKPKPDQVVVHRLWEGIDKMAKVAGLVDLATRISLGIQQILG